MIRFGYRIKLKPKLKSNKNKRSGCYRIYSFNNFFRFFTVIGNFNSNYTKLSGFKYCMFSLNNIIKLNNNFFYRLTKIFYFYFVVTILLNLFVFEKKKIFFFVSKFIYKSLIKNDTSS